MSHTSIASTRDYISGRDRGDLTDPAQAASFTSDPLLVPISTSSMPKPILPDPTPSDNPELFDKSTSHPNTHYHPDAKLSKKKRAKKLGVGYVAKPHGGAHGTGGVNAGGRTFSEHDKEAHERAERRDAALGSQEHEEEYETDEDDEAQEEEQSHKQHAENRVTGTEKGEKPPASKKQDEEGEGDKQQKESGDGQDEDSTDNPSLMQRASNVLSSAQQKATGMVSGVTSTVMSTAQSVPVVGTLLSKVGLGAARSDDKVEDAAGGTADSQDGDKTDDSGAAGGQQQRSQGQAGGDNDARSKVGGAKEAATEATQAGGSEDTTKEAATRGGGETFGKQGARQDNHEGALDKSRSLAGQKHADNMKAS